MAAATDNIGIAKRAMKQKAMYWAPLELDDYGKPTYSDPIEIDCRWEDKVEEFIEPLYRQPDGCSTEQTANLPPQSHPGGVLFQPEYFFLNSRRRSFRFRIF